MGSGTFVWPSFPMDVEVGPFQLLKKITDDGNMSRTYTATYRQENGVRRSLAIKIARADIEVYANFLRDEVEQLRKLRHPSIVHIYPINLGGRKVVYIGKATALKPYFKGISPWYYAMEWLPGGSLQHHYKTVLRYPLEWRLELLYQIALALQHMHQLNIAHLDLKMENVVFRTPPDPNKKPDPVLVDFGLASRHDSRQRDKAGTVMYLSPDRVEEIKGMKAHYRTSIQPLIVDHKPADVWALGVIAYELLAGTYPFKPYRNEEELGLNILHKSPPKIAGIHEDLERIICGSVPSDAQVSEQGMLSKVRENRLTVFDFIELLDSETPYLPPRVGE